MDYYFFFFFFGYSQFVNLSYELLWFFIPKIFVGKYFNTLGVHFDTIYFAEIENDKKLFFGYVQF